MAFQRSLTAFTLPTDQKKHLFFICAIANLENTGCPLGLLFQLQGTASTSPCILHFCLYGVKMVYGSGQPPHLKFSELRKQSFVLSHGLWFWGTVLYTGALTFNSKDDIREESLKEILSSQQEISCSTNILAKPCNVTDCMAYSKSALQSMRILEDDDGLGWSG